MAKIGLWLELEVGIGFLVGLGLGSLTGQRTLTTITLIGLEIIVTPVLAGHVIPYFLDGQRLVVGLAMDQLRPAALAPGGPGGGGPGRVLTAGIGSCQPPKSSRNRARPSPSSLPPAAAFHVAYQMIRPPPVGPRPKRAPRPQVSVPSRGSGTDPGAVMPRTTM
jgi:hypothetical protein